MTDATDSIVGRTRLDIPNNIYKYIVYPIVCGALFYFIILPKVFNLW